MKSVGEKIWYGYVDYTDDGRPYYVGEGLIARARSRKRNDKHTDISEEFGWNRIEEYCSKSEQAVLEWERATCARLGTYKTRYSGIGCNFTECGEKTTTGYHHTPETKAKLSAMKLGTKQKPRGPEWRAKLSAALKGKPLSLETRRKLSIAATGKIRGPRSPEAIAKSAAAHIGMRHTPEARKKISEAAKHRSAEVVAAHVKAMHSPESRAKAGASMRGQKRKSPSSETRLKMSLANSGKPKKPETVAKIAASNRGKKRKPEHLANLRRGYVLHLLAYRGADHTAEVLEQEAVEDAAWWAQERRDNAYWDWVEGGGWQDEEAA